MKRLLLSATILFSCQSGQSPSLPEKKNTEGVEVKKALTELEKTPPPAVDKKKSALVPPQKEAKPTPLTDEEKKTQKAFGAAMKIGREATLAADYTKAVTAFDEALALLKDNPQALAERGYAKLKTKDYEAAEKDLMAAREKTPKPKLEGQIWFNLGLIAEGRRDFDGAKLAFAKSDALNPSKAAKKRLTSGPACTAKIDRKAIPGNTASSWLAAYQDLSVEVEGSTVETPPTNEAEAKALLCPDCTATSPSIVRLGAEYYWYYHAVFALADGKPLIFSNLGEGMMARCSYNDELTIDPKNPTHLTALSEMQDLTYVMSVDRSDGTSELVDCDGVGDCMSACFIGSSTKTDYFFDLKTKSLALIITRYQTEGSAKPGENTNSRWSTNIDLKVEENNIAVKGGGCDEKLSW
jgi:tetratricopeptide (TPR) repeat protein